MIRRRREQCELYFPTKWEGTVGDSTSAERVAETMQDLDAQIKRHGVRKLKAIETEDGVLYQYVDGPMLATIVPLSEDATKLMVVDVAQLQYVSLLT